MDKSENPMSAKGVESPEQHGERLGEQLAERERIEATEASGPSAAASDKKKHVGLVVAIVAFVVLLIGAGVAYSALAPTSERTPVVEKPAAEQADPEAPAPTNEPDASTTAAPNFTMTDSQGKTLQLSDFKGKPVLLNFWASWCGPCQSEMPAIQKAWEQYGSDVDFVIVNMTGMSGETEEAAKAFLTDGGYTFPAYFDKDNSAAMAFGVSSIPQTYLLNADGDIIGGYMGAMNDAVLAEGIQMLLNTAKD
jgi:thiol-disulfide isomerase/thioredoxin